MDSATYRRSPFRSLTLLAASALLTLACNVQGALVTYSAQVEATGFTNVDPSEIAAGDIFHLSFTLDEDALSYDDGEVLVWELDDSVRAFSMTRDAGNTGLWTPGPLELDFYQIRMEDSTLSFRFDFVDSEPLSVNTPTGATVPLSVVILRYEASGPIADGDPLSKFLSPVMTPTGQTFEFHNDEAVSAYLGTTSGPATAAVPEPSAALLLGLAAVGLAARRRPARA